MTIRTAVWKDDVHTLQRLMKANVNVTDADVSYTGWVSNCL